jgi:hypothetical protein
MSGWVNDTSLDLALQDIINRSNLLVLCSEQPTTYAQAFTTYKLGSISINSGDWAGPTDGDVSGRKITLLEQLGIPIVTGGICTHWAVVNTGTSALVYVWIVNPKTFVAAEECNAEAADIELRYPS